MVIGAESEFSMPDSIPTRLVYIMLMLLENAWIYFSSIYGLNNRADRARWKIMNSKPAKKWGIDSVKKISCPSQTTTTIAALHVMSL